MKILHLKHLAEDYVGPFLFKEKAKKDWFRYVRTEDVLNIRRMIRRGINLELKDERGLTAMYYALGQHGLDVFILLLKKGAKLDLSTKKKLVEFAENISSKSIMLREKAINVIPSENAQDFLRKYFENKQKIMHRSTQSFKKWVDSIGFQAKRIYIKATRRRR
jgi:hypothetical protein